MHRNRNKKLTLLLAILFFMAIMIPMAGPAFASVTFTANTPTVSTNVTNATLGTIVISADVLNAGTHKFLVSLPSDFKHGYVVADDGSVIGAQIEATGGAVTSRVYVLNDREFRVETAASAAAVKVKFSVPFKAANVTVPSTATGDVMATITKLDGDIPDGSLPVGKISEKNLTLSVVDARTITDAGTIGGNKIEITMNGTLKASSSNSVRFTLPNGFKWANETIENVATGGVVAAGVTVGKDERKLTVTSTNEVNSVIYRVKADITVDETIAKQGDVVADVSGASSYSPSELTVAKYADYGVTIEDKALKTIVAGKNDQEIAEFVIKEDIKGSIVGTRTVTLTLPSWAKWDGDYNPNTDAGTTTIASGKRANDDQVLKFTTSSSSAGTKSTMLFKQFKVKLAGDAQGDLVVTIGGSAGIQGEVKVATVVPPVSGASLGEAANLKIGVQSQDAPSFTITEGKAEAIKKHTAAGNEIMTIKTPAGVTWAADPTVKVIEGDISIDSVTRDGRELTVKVKSASAKASKIEFSNVKLTLDRTVPEGPVKLNVSGNAINTTSADWPNATVASFVLASTITPAPGDTKQSAAFVIGSTTYNVGGVENTMDVAPYVKNGRTYLPIRYAGYALGVEEENIFWDNTTGTATLMKGDRVVQFTVGSKVMVINGATIALDVAPEVTNGRTMLPFRWIATAFGASVDWDSTTQTVTIK